MGPKQAGERIDNLLNFDWPANLFQGINVPVVKRILDKKLDDHYTWPDQVLLSKAISLGGGRIFKRDATTELRQLKRLTMLFHQVLGCHTLVETKSLKRSILNLDEREMQVVAAQIFKRVLSFLRDRKSWAEEIPLRFGGRLVYYYSQGDDPRIGKMDITENGWCLGMSVQWLADRAARIDFWAPTTHRKQPVRTGL